jgi:hypothetical protein
MVLLLVLLVKFSVIVNSQDVDCEETQTRKAASGVLIKSCRMDGVTVISSNDVSFTPEADEEMTEIYGDFNHKINHLPNNISEKFPMLISLSFRFCSLKTVKKESFKELTQIEHIDLSYNEIATIEIGTFDDLKNLLYLFLAFNEIKILNADVFIPLVKLKSLSLSFNLCIDEDFYDEGYRELDMPAVRKSIWESCSLYEIYEECMKKLEIVEKLKATCTKRSDTTEKAVFTETTSAENPAEVETTVTRSESITEQAKSTEEAEITEETTTIEDPAEVETTVTRSESLTEQATTTEEAAIIEETTTIEEAVTTEEEAIIEEEKM